MQPLRDDVEAEKTRDDQAVSRRNATAEVKEAFGRDRSRSASNFFADMRR